jgi:hypothetical protein
VNYEVHVADCLEAPTVNYADYLEMMSDWSNQAQRDTRGGADLGLSKQNSQGGSGAQ